MSTTRRLQETSLKASHQCYMRMTCNTPTPGHPSAADEAWYWQKPYCALGDFHFKHACVIYGCLYPRELCFIDLIMYSHVYTYPGSRRKLGRMTSAGDVQCVGYSSGERGRGSSSGERDRSRSSGERRRGRSSTDGSRGSSRSSRRESGGGSSSGGGGRVKLSMSGGSSGGGNGHRKVIYVHLHVTG